MVKVRKGWKNDIPALVELGEKFHKESIYSNEEYSKVRAAMFLSGFTGWDDCILLVAEKDGELCGFIAGNVEPSFCSEGYYAKDAVIVGHGCGSELVAAFENWAKDVGAVKIFLSSSSGKNTHPFFQKEGYSPVGGVFVKEVG